MTSIENRVSRLRRFFEAVSQTGDFSLTNDSFDDHEMEFRRPEVAAPNHLSVDESIDIAQNKVVNAREANVSMLIGKTAVPESVLLVKDSSEEFGIYNESQANIVVQQSSLQSGRQNISPMSSDKVIMTSVPMHNDLSLQDNRGSPMFVASVMSSFENKDVRELRAALNDVVEVFEVTSDGWCLASVDERIGWIPQSYLEILETTKNIDECLFQAMPLQQEREAVLCFIKKSSLFSEVLQHRKVPVYTDAIDRIINAAGSTAGALSALSELDSHKKKFNDIEALPDAIFEIIGRWMSIAEDARSLLNENAHLLFTEKQAFELFTLDDVIRLLTESTCGSDISFRLWEEIQSKPSIPHDSIDTLKSSLAVRHLKFLESKKKHYLDQCAIVFAALRQPSCDVFERFLDLRVNPIDQLLANGLDAKQIVSRLQLFAQEGKHFATLEDMMVAVFVAETDSDVSTSVLCMGEGSVFSGKYNIGDAEDEKEEQKLAEMKPSERFKVMSAAFIKELSDPEIKLFSEIPAHVSVSRQALRSLVSSASTLRTLVCNTRILNSSGTKFSSFKDFVEGWDNSPLLITEKMRVQRSLQFVFNGDYEITFRDVECFLNCSGAFGFRAEYFLVQDAAIARQKPFKSIKEVSDAVAKRCTEEQTSRKVEKVSLLQWFRENALFHQEFEIYSSSIDELFDMAVTYNHLLENLNALVDEDAEFNNFDELKAVIQRRIDSEIEEILQ